MKGLQEIHKCATDQLQRLARLRDQERISMVGDAPKLVKCLEETLHRVVALVEALKEYEVGRENPYVEGGVVGSEALSGSGKEKDRLHDCRQDSGESLP